MFFVSLITSIYYNMLNAWAVFYIAASFAKDVPWRKCGNEWNTDREYLRVLQVLEEVFALMTSAFLTLTPTFLDDVKDWSGPFFDARQLVGVRLNFDVDVKILLSLTSTTSV